MSAAREEARKALADVLEDLDSELWLYYKGNALYPSAVEFADRILALPSVRRAILAETMDADEAAAHTQPRRIEP